MRLFWLAGLAVAIFLGGAGCNSSESVTAPPVKSQRFDPRAGQEQLQPRLPTIKLWLGAQELITEQALTEEQRRVGMMFRKEMPENEAMLFVFPFATRLAFWMRNTVVPLSCAYIDRDGVILEIRDLQPLNETPVESVSDRVQYVLETNQGWFERNQVGVGTVVRTEKGSLAEAYFGGQR